MFDPKTKKLLLDAPKLDGLENSDIPRLLTESYAQIISARIRLRDRSINDKNVNDNIEILRRLSSTHEALVATMKDNNHRESAAFVAASAHHACMLYNKTIMIEDDITVLNKHFISSEISAAILYLIANSITDANEITKNFIFMDDGSIESSLIKGISLLCRGRLQELIQIRIDESIISELNFSENSAAKLLYFIIFQAVQLIAKKISFTDNSEEATAGNLLEQVLDLSVENLHIKNGENAEQKSVYSGPYHLAKLLMMAYPDLISSSLLNIPTPNGISAKKWNSLLSHISMNRPYIWKNHQHAINEGLLNDVSAAISFPTGAGKSTLSELKIASVLAKNKNIVFLAPTLSLVDQTTKSLKISFPNYEILKDSNEETLLTNDLERLLPISVFTPEKCLMLLNFRPGLFENTGLLIFDECHLLHPRSSEKSRRALDSMLCIINIVNIVKDIKLLLLSAMMKNTDEIANWLADITNKQCLSLNLDWKPTRQVRGCVVYEEEEVNKLKEILYNERVVSNNKSVPLKLKNELKAKPLGLFCLHQTWQSTSRNDYSLIPLLDEPVKLSAGHILPENVDDKNENYKWYLTPNSLKVSGEIAANSAIKNLKTILFVQTIPNSISTDKYISSLIKDEPIHLNDHEISIQHLLEVELGDLDASYLVFDPNTKSINNKSTCHHGHLLSIERKLHESLFSRNDGINVLVATSTLSQGMNLPSDIVIIGGDSRFDPESQKLDQLEAHELLNTAGRAGRAGDRSHGFVLIVPSKIIDFNNENSRIHKYWSELQSIFSQSDQCLIIEDPMAPILDSIHNTSEELNELSSYLIGRLYFNINTSDSKDKDAYNIINNSLAAYQARVRSDHKWLSDRLNSLQKVSESRSEGTDWQRKLAASTGVDVKIIAELSGMLNGTIRFEATTIEWFNWITEWLVNNPTHLQILIRNETIESFMGTSFKKMLNGSDKWIQATEKLLPLLNAWISGESLKEIEIKCGTKPHLIKTCEKAREFVLRIVPELAYVYGLPSQVYLALCLSKSSEIHIPLALDKLGSCVKKGYDQVEKLALEIVDDKNTIRRLVHKDFIKLSEFIPPFEKNDTFQVVLERVRVAKIISSL
ncbi:DEAD/DEAH box helicase [Pantoea sp.]|uniref:DEAD/DEAH box helicase n=1 Tax=Pantoea sp. TaxID=69393 RepID=UPI0028AB4774|nr:DEAD/DEAH box helicase [Pantoea sp.]